EKNSSMCWPFIGEARSQAMGKSQSPIVYLIVLLLAAAVVFFTMQPKASPPQNQTPPNQTPPQNITPPPLNVSNNTVNTNPQPSNVSNITIATFNIQIFGEAKRSKPQVMDVLAKTARNFDLMVIQELRDDTETTLPIYLEKINSLPGPKYSSISSP